jgi:hypothetical protein
MQVNVTIPLPWTYFFVAGIHALPDLIVLYMDFHKVSFSSVLMIYIRSENKYYFSKNHV